MPVVTESNLRQVRNGTICWAECGHFIPIRNFFEMLLRFCSEYLLYRLVTISGGQVTFTKLRRYFTSVTGEKLATFNSLPILPCNGTATVTSNFVLTVTKSLLITPKSFFIMYFSLPKSIPPHPLGGTRVRRQWRAVYYFISYYGTTFSTYHVMMTVCYILV